LFERFESNNGERTTDSSSPVENRRSFPLDRAARRHSTARSQMTINFAN
jgi:hypothetical protein